MKLEKVLDKKSLYKYSHYGVILDGKLVVTNGHLAVVTPLENLIKKEDVSKLEGYLFYYDAIKVLSSKDSMKLKITDGCVSLNGVDYKAVDRYGAEGKIKDYLSTYDIRKIIFVDRGEPCIVRAISGKLLKLFEDVVDIKNSYTRIYNVKGREDKIQYFIEMNNDNTGTYGVIAGIENSEDY